MSMGRAVLCVAVLLCAACTKSEPAAESAACCTNDAPTHSHDKAAAAAPAAASGAWPVDGFQRDVIVRGEVTPSGVVMSVQNHGTTNVSLKSAVRVEQHIGDLHALTETGSVALPRWVSVTATGVALRDSCASEPPACVTLAPGAELLPPAWPAVVGRGPCGACPECPAIADGEYHFVVEACEGNGAAMGETFSIRAADGH